MDRDRRAPSGRLRAALLIALLAPLVTSAASGTPSTGARTNLFIGSGGPPQASGMTFPGAARPFGKVRLSPDTREDSSLLRFAPVGSGMHSGGYRFQHERVLGFSHNRLSGTGVREGGAFRVLPVDHPDERRHRHRGVEFSHEDEHAEPGYYALELPRLRVRAELTASTHCGIHRYTRLGRGAPLHLLLDGASALHEKGGAPRGRLRIDPERRTITGELIAFGPFASRQGGLRQYFHAEYSEGIRAARTWQGRGWRDDDEASGTDIGVALELDRGATAVELKLCLSYVSEENARLNFEAEARGRDFEAARDEAIAHWDRQLDRIAVRGGDAEQERVFRTMLYFASLMPTHFSDVNGEYPGFDGRTGRADDFVYRSDLSLWDTFRTAHPLYTLIAPEIERDSLRSLLRMAEARGVFPRWPFAAADSGSMFGLPAHFLFAESWLKGHRDFDARAALGFMIQGARDDEYSREAPCRQFGYCPDDLVKGSVSRTLENAWSDHAVARFAADLGETSVAAEFARTAEAWREVWDPSRRFFRPRDSQGRFLPFSPRITSYLKLLGRNADAYVEGSPWQWRFSAPHAGPALVEAFGGPDAFARELERFLEGATNRRAALYPGARYWHGNQHNLHAIYLFNEAGRPELTQKWARWALRTRYANTPDGLDGNDDGGTLSAWYVLSALGLYPQAGTEHYWLGSPAVASASLDLGEGRRLHVLARDQSRENVYVQAVFRNGVRWCRPSITHAELSDATLEFELGPAPASRGGYDCAATESVSSP